MNEPKRPSHPPTTARKCSDCKCMKDDSGDTHGWALCQCGSFRMPTQLESAFANEPQRSLVEKALRKLAST